MSQALPVAEQIRGRLGGTEDTRATFALSDGELRAVAQIAQCSDECLRYDSKVSFILGPAGAGAARQPCALPHHMFLVVSTAG